MSNSDLRNIANDLRTLAGRLEGLTAPDPPIYRPTIQKPDISLGSIPGNAQHISEMLGYPVPWVSNPEHFDITSNGLRAFTEPDETGSTNAQFYTDITPTDSIRISYRLSIPAHFEFGGELEHCKLGFGLGGGDFPSAGERSDNGFTLRLEQRDGKFGLYSYYKEHLGKYGKDLMSDISIDPGRWYVVQQSIKPALNEGLSDVRLLIDDKCAVNLENVDLMDPGTAISRIIFDFFYGGDSDKWSPSTDQYITVSNFQVYQS